MSLQEPDRLRARAAFLDTLVSALLDGQFVLLAPSGRMLKASTLEELRRLSYHLETPTLGPERTQAPSFKLELSDAPEDSAPGG